MKKSLKTHILVAADSLERLRKCDVYRVLEWAPAKKRAALAKYITNGRPDLTDEVREVMDELP